MEAARAYGFSIGANVVLAIIRFLAAALTFSHAMVAIGLFSLLSLLASLTTFHLVRVSGLPPDEVHTYGYAKYHSLSRVVEVLLTLVVAGFILLQGASGLLSQSAIVNPLIAIAALIVSIPIDVTAYTWLRAGARRADSDELEYEPARFGNDLLITLLVLLTIIALMASGNNDIDDVAALIVGVYVLVSAWLKFRRLDIGLLDGRLPAEEEMVVRNVLLHHSPQFIGFHKLRTRQSGNQKFIDFHLQVRGDMTVEDAHRLVDHLEKEIEKRLPRTNVIIHVEPDE